MQRFKNWETVQLEITSLNLLTSVSANFDDISTEFLLGYFYIKEAECLERLFLSSISMQREKIEKQFKETVQKHSNLINTTHKTSVPGWHYVVSQKALHLHPLGLHHAV